MKITINNRTIDDNSHSYVIAEIGLNHNGDLKLAKKLIIQAKKCGADAVKFQKRFPDECVPEKKKAEIRHTPWGKMSYLDYRHKLEFGENDYLQIKDLCIEQSIDWLVSVWDHSSVDFIQKFDPVAVKVPSDKMNDLIFLKRVKELNCPIILSSGGTSLDIIDKALSVVGKENVALLQCTSIYPCLTSQLDLKVITSFKEKYGLVCGLSSHHTSPIFGSFALSYGAKIVEQHFTLNRSFWGSDQSMSLEPRGLELLVKYIRMYEESKGDGVKKVYDAEKKVLSRTTGR
jgi:N-acetylneuraminate synthase